MKARVHNMLVFIFTQIFVVHQDKLGHQNLNVIELNSHHFLLLLKETVK